MNIYTNAFWANLRFLFLFFIGFGVSHAQLSLPKTLDDPGSFPLVEKIFDSDDVTLFFQRAPFITTFFTYYYTNGNVGVSVLEDNYEDYYYIEYQEDEQTPIRITPENESILSFENTPTATKASFRVWVDPFASDDIDATLTDTTLEDFFLSGNADLPRVDRAALVASTVSSDASKSGSVTSFGAKGTPIHFSSDELLVLGDEDGHSLRLAQTGVVPKLSVDFSIPADADAQAIKTAIREAAAKLTIYIAGEVQDDGSLLIFADEALEIREATSPGTSKTLDDPGSFPLVEKIFDSDDVALSFEKVPDIILFSYLYTNGNVGVSVYEDNYEDYYYIEYQEDEQTPIRITPENVSSLSFENTPTATKASFRVWVDPFASDDIDATLTDTTLEDFFLRGNADLPTIDRAALVASTLSSDASKSGKEISFGARGTPIHFSSDELLVLGDEDGHSLRLAQTGVVPKLSVDFSIPADADAQAIKTAIREAAAKLTIYIAGEVQDDGSLLIYTDEAIVVEYTIDPAASTTPLQSQGVLVYPNPVRTHLNLDYPSATPATYTVYELTGKRHSSHHASGQTHRIDVSGLSKGVYLLESKHGNQTGVYRFVKE